MESSSELDRNALLEDIEDQLRKGCDVNDIKVTIEVHRISYLFS